MSERKRGTCRVCGRQGLLLQVTGMVRFHATEEVAWEETCPGSGQPPREEPADDLAE